MREVELIPYPKEPLLWRGIRVVIIGTLALLIFLFGYWLGYNS